MMTPDERREKKQERDRRKSARNRAEHPEKVREIQRRWYEAHRQERLEYNHQYREEHREELCEYDRRRCTPERSRHNYERHREERLEHARRYYEAHQEEIRERNRRYHEKCREEVNETRRRYREEHLEEKRAKQRLYNRRTGQDRAYQHHRRAQKRSLQHDFTPDQWARALEYWHGGCAYCGNPPRLWDSPPVLHQDHFVPLTANGPYTVTNMLPACPSCNISKRDNAPTTWLVARFGKRQAKIITGRIRAYFEWVQVQDGETISCEEFGL